MVLRNLKRLCLLALIGLGMSWADQPYPWQMGFQAPATPVMEKIHHLFDYTLGVTVIIALVVAGLLSYVIFRFRASKNPVPSKTTHHTLLEVVWTVIPVIIIATIAVPSLRLLTFMGGHHKADLTLKVIAHQWYWEYTYPDHKVEFMSNMIKRKDIKPGQLSQLEVDEPIVLPINRDIRVIVTSADVQHSWAVPAFGIKQDAYPGRLREVWLRITKEGTYYGQCSELCGLGHGFMSIVVHAVSPEAFQHWVATKKTPDKPEAKNGSGKKTARYDGRHRKKHSKHSSLIQQVKADHP
jgi:cytochrome c oxidase subunit 2